MTKYEKNETIMKVISIISIVSISVGIVFGISSLFIHERWMETVACYGFTFFMLPALFLHVAMPAGFHTYGMKSMGWWSVLFFLGLFPAADIWFFSGMDAIYHFLPDFHLIMNRSERDTVRLESYRQARVYIGIMYFSLIGLGLLLKAMKKKEQIVLV